MNLWTEFQEYFIPLAVFLGVLIIGLIIRKFLFNRLTSLVGKTRTHLDNIITASSKGPFLLWMLILAIYLGLRFAALSENIMDIAGKVLLVLAIISVTLFLANLTVRLIREYSSRMDTTLPVSSLTQNIARAVIFAIGILVILGSFQIDITPVLATLGIGGLAVALALQDTLSNVFAGFYIAASRQIHVGDYVKLDSGEEGYVTDIQWRTTQIKMLSNNVILVPNERLAKAIVTNYYLPQKEMSVLVNLGVHYKSDLEHVERVTVEVAREVMNKVNGAVPEFEPFIRYNEFGDSNINFSVILRAKEFTDQYLIKHEFIKRLQARYNQEGIVIPFPIRAINYEQERENPPGQAP